MFAPVFVNQGKIGYVKLIVCKKVLAYTYNFQIQKLSQNTDISCLGLNPNQFYLFLVNNITIVIMHFW